MKKLFIALLSLIAITANAKIETSVAGLFPLENSGRMVWNFNPEWRFHLGDVAGAEAIGFDDTAWDVVSTPHTAKLLPRLYRHHFHRRHNMYLNYRLL